MVMLGFLSGAVLPEGASIAPILRLLALLFKLTFFQLNTKYLTSTHRKRATITGSTLRARSDQYKTGERKGEGGRWEESGFIFCIKK